MEGVKEPDGNRFRYTSKGLIPRLFEGIFSEFGNDEKVCSPPPLLLSLTLPHSAQQCARPRTPRQAPRVSGPSSGLRARHRDSLRVCALQVTGYELSIQFVELYNEQLLDLFGGKKVVDVTMDPNGGYRCKDAVTQVCKNYDDAMRMCALARRRCP
jgi:hypothetical protein